MQPYFKVYGIPAFGISVLSKSKRHRRCNGWKTGTVILNPLPETKNIQGSNGQRATEIELKSVAFSLRIKMGKDRAPLDPLPCC